MTQQAVVEFLGIEFSEDTEQVLDPDDKFGIAPRYRNKIKATVSLKVWLGSTTFPMSVDVHPQDDLSDIKSLVFAELHAFGSALADATQTPK